MHGRRKAGFGDAVANPCVDLGAKLVAEEAPPSVGNGEISLSSGMAPDLDGCEGRSGEGLHRLGKGVLAAGTSEAKATVGGVQTLVGNAERSRRRRCRADDDVAQGSQVARTPVTGVLDSGSEFGIDLAHAIGEDRPTGSARAALAIAPGREADALR